MSAPAPPATVPAVLLGGGIIGLSAARCLGPEGITVRILGDPAEHGSAAHSRYCSSFVDVGSGSGVKDRWLEWLREKHDPGAVVLPCSDEAVELVCRNRAELLELGYRPMEADDDVALAMLDKFETYERAARAGIETPRHFRLDALDQLEEQLENSGMAFPCALKPLQSHLFRRHFQGKVLLVRDREELRAAAGKVAEHGIAVMVTEIIPGPEDAYLAFHGFFDEHGRPLVQLTKRKLRQYPAGFGLGTYHVTDWNPEVAELGLAFCQGVGLRGLGNPEFKRDARDGRLKLIECNHRFSLVNELLRRAGINTPLLAYNRLTGRPARQPGTYRRGVRLWYPAGDYLAYRELKSRGETTLPRWLASLAHVQHVAIYDRRDPKPALTEWGSRLRRIPFRTRAAAPPGA